ncbi:MAG TPA: PIG-L deacetylase family protein [Verrucomicrobiae bacterium]|nr:PIG-L deacetylase family protein [Verrucomicrobiae bacterium]
MVFAAGAAADRDEAHMMQEPEKIPYRPEPLGRHSVVVLAPHADDEALGPGGSILQHVRGGDAVKIVIVTDDPAQPEERKRECLEAAAKLGVKDVEFLGLKERAHDAALYKKKFRAVFESAGPTLVYLPHAGELHPDHCAVSEAGLAAARGMKPPLWLAFYEVSAPLARVNRLVDITAEMTMKQNAVGCYKTQLAQNDYLNKICALNRYRSYTLGKEVIYAEAYFLARSDGKDFGPPPGWGLKKSPLSFILSPRGRGKGEG